MIVCSSQISHNHEVSISYGSEIIAKVKIDNGQDRQTDKTKKTTVNQVGA